MAYTIHDTPATVARIETDIQRVLSRLREADPKLRALVLTGGFARGEGAVVDGAPQNDYDFVAIRDVGRPHVPYGRLRDELGRAIGLHLDLAPVASWRLPWVAPSIFWYETALRGRVVWGEELLGEIRVRDAHRLHKGEALRLLVNRAAGLLLVTETLDPHQRRIQAAKGLLAAFDAHLLAHGEFPPSQTERWDRYRTLRRARAAPAALLGWHDWLCWAYGFKVDPQSASAVVDADDAWKAAARAIVDAVPVALRHAGLASLDAYARQGGVLDRIFYCLHAGEVRGANRFASNPTGRVRVGTLRLLAGSLDGMVHRHAAEQHLGPMARVSERPMQALAALRKATLQ